MANDILKQNMNSQTTPVSGIGKEKEKLGYPYL